MVIRGWYITFLRKLRCTLYNFGDFWRFRRIESQSLTGSSHCCSMSQNGSKSVARIWSLLFSQVIPSFFNLFHVSLGVAWLLFEAFCEAFETNSSYLKALLAAAFSNQLLLGLGAVGWMIWGRTKHEYI